MANQQKEHNHEKYIQLGTTLLLIIQCLSSFVYGSSCCLQICESPRNYPKNGTYSSL